MFRGYIGDCAEGPTAGVIQQDFGRAELFTDRLEQRLYLGSVAQISRGLTDLAPFSTDFFRQRCEVFVRRALIATAYSLANRRARAAPKPGPTPSTAATGFSAIVSSFRF